MGKSIFRWVLGGTVRKAGMGQEFVLPVFCVLGDVYEGGWMANDPSDRGNEIEQNVCIDKCSGKDLSVRNVKNAQMFEAGLISKNGLTPHPLLTYNLI